MISNISNSICIYNYIQNLAANKESPNRDQYADELMEWRKFNGDTELNACITNQPTLNAEYMTHNRVMNNNKILLYKPVPHADLRPKQKSPQLTADDI
jgi:hypothetical protein